MGKLTTGKIRRIIFFGLSSIFLLSSLGYATGQDQVKLAFGPYVPLSPGRYEITFTLRIADNTVSHPVANFEIVSNGARVKYISKTISGTDFKTSSTYQDFNVQFQTTTGAKDFEFRITYLGGAKLWAEKVGVTLLQSYSKEEAMGTDLILGYSKRNAPAAIESFLKSSRHKEIRIDDPRFSRRIGYLVSDPRASMGRAWFVKPSMAVVYDEPVASSEARDSKAAPLPNISEIRLPKLSTGLEVRAAPKTWFLPTLVFLSGYVFALINVFIYRRSSFRRLAARFRSLTLFDARVFIFRLGKNLIALALLLGILLWTYFEIPAVYGFAIRIEYLFVAFLILSLIQNIDSRVSVGLALVLLGVSSVFLILEQETLAEQTAISVYYFLLSGIALQVIDYVREPRAQRAAPASVRISPRSLDLNLNSASSHEIPFRREQKEAVNRLKGRRPAILLGTALLLVILVSSAIFFPSVLGLRPFKYPGTAGKKTAKHLRPRVLGEGVSGGEATRPAKSGALPVDPDKKKMRLEILNGNGIRNDAAQVHALLEQNGFKDVETKNADSFDYPQTIVRHRIGEKRGAEMVAASLAGDRTLLFSDDLPGDYSADVVVTLGRERLDRAKIKILVLNGGGVEGEATKKTAVLKEAGFTVLAPRDAESNDLSGTAVRYKKGLGKIAETVVSLIFESRSSTFVEDLSPLSSADIILVLGQRKTLVHGRTVD